MRLLILAWEECTLSNQLRSRRGFLFGAMQAPSTATLTAVNGVRGGVRLVASGDSEFEASISTGYSKISDMQFFNRFKPLTAILRHEGALTVKAYCVHWLVKEESGGTRNIHAHYILKHSMPKPAVRSLEPGAARLVSPFFNVSLSEYAADPVRVASLVPREFPFFDREVMATSLDAVIYSDGSLVGPDLFRLGDRYVASRNAEQDAAISVKRQMRVDGSVAGIERMLQRHIEIGVAAQSAEPKAIYLRSRAQEAVLLQRTLHARGLPALTKEVQRKSRFPRDQVVRAV